MAIPPDFGSERERGGPDDPGLEHARQSKPPPRGRQRAGYAVVGILLIAIVVAVVLLLVL